MNYMKYRRYPRVYKRNPSIKTKSEEASIDLSLSAAIGILAATFTTGILGGYILKKVMD